MGHQESGPQSQKESIRLLAAVVTALIVGVLLVLTVYLVPQLESSVPLVEGLLHPRRRMAE
jgi:hypothetical protein